MPRPLSEAARARLGLACPDCGCIESDVIDSRPRDRHISRRRRCTSCRAHWRTAEVAETVLRDLMKIANRNPGMVLVEALRRLGWTPPG